MKSAKRGFSFERQNRKLGYKLLIPSSLLILVISVYPLFYGIYLGFTNQHFLKPNQNDFIGFDNFTKLFSDSAYFSALGFSLIYTVSVVVLAYLMGLGLALLLNREFKGRGLLRALVLIPWVIPSTVAATQWRWVLDSQVGIINNVLRAWGLIDKPILFLANMGLVRFTMIGIGVWKAFPFMMITLLSGLQGIPDDLYEAARIDGANAWRSFRHITFPLLQPVSFIALTLMSIWTFNNFENIYLLTQGGPLSQTTTLSIFSYKTAFFSNNISYASAAATTMMFFMGAFGFIYLRVLFRDTGRAERKKVGK